MVSLTEFLNWLCVLNFALLTGSAINVYRASSYQIDILESGSGLLNKHGRMLRKIYLFSLCASLPLFFAFILASSGCSMLVTLQAGIVSFIFISFIMLAKHVGSTKSTESLRLNIVNFKNRYRYSFDDNSAFVLFAWPLEHIDKKSYVRFSRDHELELEPVNPQEPWLRPGKSHVLDARLPEIKLRNIDNEEVVSEFIISYRFQDWDKVCRLEWYRDTTWATYFDYAAKNIRQELIAQSSATENALQIATILKELLEERLMPVGIQVLNVFAVKYSVKQTDNIGPKLALARGKQNTELVN